MQVTAHSCDQSQIAACQSPATFSWLWSVSLPLFSFFFMLNIYMLAWMLKKRDERFKKLKTLPYQKKKKDLRRLCFSITGAVSLKDWGTFTSSIRMRRCLLTCMHKGLTHFLVSPFIFDLSSCDNCSFQSFFHLIIQMGEKFISFLSAKKRSP